MGLTLLRKGSECFIGPEFTPFDPPTFVIIVKRPYFGNYVAKTSLC